MAQQQAKQQNKQQSAATGTAIAKVIKEELESSRPTFDQLNLNGLNFFKELEFATQIFQNNTYLWGANSESKRNALVNVALSGLSLSPVLKYAYLVPRNIKKVLCCVLEPSYMGLCKILTDTGSVITISATIVYEKEAPSLVIQQGAGGYAKHTAYIGFEKPGKAVACYSKAILPSGIEHVELLRPWEWEDIKRRSEAVKSYNSKKAQGEYAAEPTWMTDEEEMIRKTCIKKHYKYLPKTEQAEKVAKVIDLDNQANGIDFSEQQKTQQQADQAAATPNAPEIALATDEDLAALIEWLDNENLPDVIFEAKDKKGVNKKAMKTAIEKKFNEGKLAKDKAEEYIAGLKAEVDKAVAEKEVG